MPKKIDKSKYGNYQNGQFVSINGYSNSGLLCPKGVRLYDENHIRPVFIFPSDLHPGEQFTGLTERAAPLVMPYYAISNYGRVLQIYTNKIMKVNYRPNGYAYFCLAAKDHQRKYTLHRMVMLTFKYFDGCENFQINHINGDKSQNFVDIPDEDGNLYSNLEWVTASQNSLHACEYGLRSVVKILTPEIVNDICSMFQSEYTIADVSRKYDISYATVQMIYEHKNWTYISNNYHFN